MDNETTHTITLNPNTPMKEIPMDELKSNIENDDAFRHFLEAGSAVLRTAHELMEENARLRKDNADLVGTVKQLTARALNAEAENERLLQQDKTSAVMPEDYQILKDFKGEMDAIHEEFDIPRDVDALCKDLKLAKSIKEVIEEKTDVDFSLPNALRDLRDLLDDYNTYNDACCNHTIDPDELDGKLDDYEAMDTACSDHGVEPGELDDTLTEWEDNAKYKKGFEELSEFVDNVKEAVEEIPSTDMEDYK